ncbi:MAG: hypothetical protein ACREDF_04035 [Thermoplasmata archaeon]
MDGKVTLLVNALPGLRLFQEGKTEEGSIIALRRDGDECLYVPRTEEDKGMDWIPVREFSVDPEAVTPVEFLEDPQPGEGEAPEAEEGAVEVPSRKGPFGGRQLKRRETTGE